MTDTAGARQALVVANLGYAIHVAKQFRNRGLPFEDLLALGHVGLLEAARRFDPSHGTKFITYAGWWMRKAILQALAEQTALVRLSGYRIKQLRETGELGAERPRTVSLDARRDGDDDMPSLSERLAAAEPGPEEDVLRDEAVRLVREELSRLPAPERRVLDRRFGLEGGERLSLNEAGQELGLSRERVRQIEERAVERLRRALRGRYARTAGAIRRAAALRCDAGAA